MHPLHAFFMRQAYWSLIFGFFLYHLLWSEYPIWIFPLQVLGVFFFSCIFGTSNYKKMKKEWDDKQKKARE